MLGNRVQVCWVIGLRVFGLTGSGSQGLWVNGCQGHGFKGLWVMGSVVWGLGSGVHGYCLGPSQALGEPSEHPAEGDSR